MVKNAANETELRLGKEYIVRDLINSKGYIVGQRCYEDIVRCEKCKNRKPGISIYGKCALMEGYFPDRHFCSYGERSEE